MPPAYRAGFLDAEILWRYADQAEIRHPGELPAARGRLFGIRRSSNRLLNRQLVYCTPGCRAFGFWLERPRGFDASAPPEPLKV